MPPPRVVRVAVRGVERGAREALAAGFAVLREEIAAQAIEQMSKGRLFFAALKGPRDGCYGCVVSRGPFRPAIRPANQIANVFCQHRELRMMAGTVVQEPVQAVTRAVEDVLELDGRGLARRRGCQIARTALQKAPEGVWCHQPPIQQRGDAGSQPSLAQLREHQRHVVVFLRDCPADTQRLIERLPDQARHIGVGRQIETRVDIRFERKLAQQRQAKRVDRRNRDVAETLLQVAPPSGVEFREAARLLEPVDDPLPHLGRGLARERDREDVIRFDAGPQQIDVALDQDPRLSGAGRRFEDDVSQGIDGRATSRGVSQGQRLGAS